MWQKLSQRLQNQNHLLVLRTNYFLDCSNLLLLSSIKLSQTLRYAKIYSNGEGGGGGGTPGAVTLVLKRVMFSFAPLSITVIYLGYVTLVSLLPL